MTEEIKALDGEISAVVATMAPALLALCGCAALTAAKIVGETADVRRFRSRNAYTTYTGTAPLPVWSSNQGQHARHGMDGAVEPELPDEADADDSFARQLVGGHQQADGDGEVEARADLADTRGARLTVVHLGNTRR